MAHPAPTSPGSLHRGTTVEDDVADGTRLIGECTLPVGHDGAHDDGAGRLVAGRITGELRNLADKV